MPSPDFENSRRLRRYRASREPDQESSPQPRSQRRPSYHDQGTQTTETIAEDIAEPQESHRHQEAAREKGDKVVAHLRKSYRWSVPTFLENYVTAERSAGSNTESHK